MPSASALATAIAASCAPAASSAAASRPARRASRNDERNASPTAVTSMSSALLAEVVVGGAVAPGEGVALGGDRAAQAGARLVGVDAVQQRRGELDLVLGRQRRVEHERHPALLGGLRGDVELVGGDRRGDGEDARDAGVAHGQQPRRVARRALGQQVAAQRR